jgi:hypothetical protein
MAFGNSQKPHWPACAGALATVAAACIGCVNPEPIVDTSGCYYLSSRSNVMRPPDSAHTQVCITVDDAMDYFTSIEDGRVLSVTLDGAAVAFESEVDDLVPIRLPQAIPLIDSGYHHIEAVWESESTTGWRMFSGSNGFDSRTQRVSFMVGVTIDGGPGSALSAVAGQDQLVRLRDGHVDLLDAANGRVLDGFTSDGTISVIPAAAGAAFHVEAAGGGQLRFWDGAVWSNLRNPAADLSVLAVDGAGNLLAVDKEGVLTAVREGAAAAVSAMTVQYVVSLNEGWMVAKDPDVNGDRTGLWVWLAITPDGRMVDIGVFSDADYPIDFVGRWDDWAGWYGRRIWVTNHEGPGADSGVEAPEGSGWLSGGAEIQTRAHVPEWLAGWGTYSPRLFCVGRDWVLLAADSDSPQVLASRHDPDVFIDIPRAVPLERLSTCVPGYGLRGDSRRFYGFENQADDAWLLIPLHPGGHWILPPP